MLGNVVCVTEGVYVAGAQQADAVQLIVRDRAACHGAGRTVVLDVFDGGVALPLFQLRVAVFVVGLVGELGALPERRVDAHQSDGTGRKRWRREFVAVLVVSALCCHEVARASPPAIRYTLAGVAFRIHERIGGWMVLGEGCQGGLTTRGVKYKVHHGKSPVVVHVSWSASETRRGSPMTLRI